MVCEVAKTNEYVAQLLSKILWKCFAQKSFANGLPIKKIRFTHFGKLNLLLLRKTQNHFHGFSVCSPQFRSVENSQFQIEGLLNETQNQSRDISRSKLF